MRDDRRRADGSGPAAARPLDGRPLTQPGGQAGSPEWTLTEHDLSFTVRESPRRKTVSLGLERDGQLLILAPTGTPASDLRRLVTARQDWLYAKVAEKARLHQPAREREYVTGEGFLYAGRSYRLLVSQEAAEGEALQLREGRFRLNRTHVPQGRALFIAWYTAHLMTWADEQLHRLRPRLHVVPARVRVADLGHRWGSCGTRRDLALHWRVALLPRRMAEYVLVHELVHLEHHHHRAAFWERLEVLMPDYVERKSWLALHGAEYDL